jgi:uncharacterized protein YdhG (YjbR/CyaY superfamily)
MKTPNNIDEYISTFPKETQTLLLKMRSIISKAAPKATEKISYAMPTFYLEGNLVYFAGYKHHIGFYPSSSGIKNFQKEIAAYKNSKGAVQFPIDKPLPVALITKIVKFRAAENTAKAKAKKSLRTCKQGHKYYKSSDCPVCPICEKSTKPKEGFLSLVSTPAKRALESKEIKTLKQLAKYSEQEILQLHGIGPSTIPPLKKELQKVGLAFKK